MADEQRKPFHYATYGEVSVGVAVTHGMSDASDGERRRRSGRFGALNESHWYIVTDKHHRRSLVLELGRGFISCKYDPLYVSEIQ